MNAQGMNAGTSFPVTGYIVNDCAGLRFAGEREYQDWYAGDGRPGDRYFEAELESVEDGAGIYSINFAFGRQSFRETYRVTMNGVERCGASVARAQ